MCIKTESFLCYRKSFAKSTLSGKKNHVCLCLFVAHRCSLPCVIMHMMKYKSYICEVAVRFKKKNYYNDRFCENKIAADPNHKYLAWRFPRLSILFSPRPIPLRSLLTAYEAL